MLEYEWGNPAATIILAGDDASQNGDLAQQIFDPLSQAFAGSLLSPATAGPWSQQPQQLLLSHSVGFSPLSPAPAGFPHHPALLYSGGADGVYQSRIELNLGRRTYFSAGDDNLMSRIYRRSRPPEAVMAPRCQVEGCGADLTQAKHYHRRHKVCEFHSKASTVVAAGLTQRFCQQCSRFHIISEFDQGKRSCRKRLADHNRRRRKSHSPQIDNPRTSLAAEGTLSRSSSESRTQSSSSAMSTRASPPTSRIPSNYIRSRLNGAVSASSSSSANSRFCPTMENFHGWEQRAMDFEGQ